MPRRRWTKPTAIAAVILVIVGAATYWGVGHSDKFTTPVTPSDPVAALAELRMGNERFVKSARTLSTDTSHDAERRHETASKQHPFAAILCCADSRVCPEFIFDQRSGSIFEIRNAGNVVDEDVLGSFEYAIEHFHVPLILVLAHKGCGAIEAVCEAGENPLPDHLQDLQKHMRGIHQQVVNVHGKHTPEILEHLCSENARQQALTLLRDSRVLKAAVDKGDARLICAIYDMETGVVEFFDPR